MVEEELFAEEIVLPPEMIEEIGKQLEFFINDCLFALYALEYLLSVTGATRERDEYHPEEYRQK
jgi:hypothetical protein